MPAFQFIGNVFVIILYVVEILLSHDPEYIIILFRPAQFPLLYGGDMINKPALPVSFLRTYCPVIVIKIVGSIKISALTHLPLAYLMYGFSS